MVSCHLKTVNFTSSFPGWIAFISFSSLIVMPSTPKTMLSNSGMSGYPCFVPDLKGSTFSFTPFRKMFAVGLSYMANLLLC